MQKVHFVSYKKMFHHSVIYILPGLDQIIFVFLDLNHFMNKSSLDILIECQRKKLVKKKRILLFAHQMNKVTFSAL